MNKDYKYTISPKFRTKLSKYLKQYGLDGVEFSKDYLGMSANYISSLLNKQTRTITYERLEKISKALAERDCILDIDALNQAEINFRKAKENEAAAKEDLWETQQKSENLSESLSSFSNAEAKQKRVQEHYKEKVEESKAAEKHYKAAQDDLSNRLEKARNEIFKSLLETLSTSVLPNASLVVPTTAKTEFYIPDVIGEQITSTIQKEMAKNMPDQLFQALSESTSTVSLPINQSEQIFNALNASSNIEDIKFRKTPSLSQRIDNIIYELSQIKSESSVLNSNPSVILETVEATLKQLPEEKQKKFCSDLADIIQKYNK